MPFAWAIDTNLRRFSFVPHLVGTVPR